MMKEKRNYTEDVYDLTQLIPEGKITTYGMIANYLQLGSARMVGWALNKSFSTERNIPAHRVVNRKGELSGRNHFKTPTLMQELLEAEGVKIKDNKVENFAKLLWNPLENL